MDDVISALANDTVQLEKRDQIREGIDITSQLGNYDHGRAFRDSRQQFSFRPAVHPTGKRDVVVRQLVETFDSQECILLSSTLNHSGDDVKNPYWLYL